MSKPHNLEEVLAQPTPPQPLDDAKAWESWDEPVPAPGESPEFDAADMADALRRPSTQHATPRPPTAPEADPPAAAPPDSLAALLASTRAPAVGLIGVDLACHRAAVPIALQAYAGTGAYGARDGRTEQRAVVVTVDREAGGRFVACAERPGERYSRPETFTPPFGGGSDAATLRWLTTTAAGVRHASAGLPLLVVVAEGCFSLPALEPVAREAGCVVAVLQHRPGVVPAVWEPRLLEPLPAAEPVAPAAEPPRPPAKRAPGDPGVAWLGAVAELVREHPEAIGGPRGEPVAVSYGHRDAQGRSHVDLRAASERGGRLWPLTIEIAPGVEVDLADVRCYI